MQLTEYSHKTKLLVSLSVMSCIPRKPSAPSLFLILLPNLSFFFFERTFVNVMGMFCGNCSAGRWNERVSDFDNRVLYCIERKESQLTVTSDGREK